MKSVFKKIFAYLISSFILFSCAEKTLMNSTSDTDKNENKSGFTVTWKDFDGTLLEEDRDVPKDAMPTFDGVEPTRPALNGIVYKFSGWSPEVKPVTYDITYIARYDYEISSYKITWKNDDGTILDSEEVKYGTFPSYKGSTPSKSSSNDSFYEFIGWNPAISPAYNDATYTAVYKEIENTYTVRWVNYDGTILYIQENVNPGSNVSYPGEEPIKIKEGYDCTFIGWSPKVNEVTSDITYTAQFNEKLKTYTIKWLNYDGTILEIDENVSHGTMPTYDGEVPEKNIEGYKYYFSGWTPEIELATKDIVYTALFSEELNTFTIRWENYDGTILEIDEEVPYGTIPTYDGEEPSKVKEGYTYFFIGWTPNVERVSSDATYVADFKEEINTYTVTWLNDDGTELEIDENVPYGTIPTYDGKIPNKVKEGYKTEFTGWSPEIKKVIENIVYTAQYREEILKFTIKWVNFDGSELEIDEDIPYGTMPTYDGEEPTREEEGFTYYFSGWSPKVEKVTKDITYTAQFSQIKNTYTITWLNYDETILEIDENIPFGELPEYNGAIPTKSLEGYTCIFIGWDHEIEKVSCNETYKAVFRDDINKYTVTWKNYDGTILEVDENVPYGTIPEYNGIEPTKTKTGYTCIFIGWSPNLDKIKSDATFIALFNDEINKYTVTWKNYDGTILEVDENVTYGSMPSYNGTTPTRENDDEYTYTFSRWDPYLSNVYSDITYTAIFNKEQIKYKIIFDLNGGSSPSYYESIYVMSLGPWIFFYDVSKEGWTFRGREYNGVVVFDENGTLLSNPKMQEVMVFKAHFTQTVKLSIVSNINEAGKFTGQGEYPYNSYVDVSVEVNQGYEFLGWYYEGTLLSKQTTYKYLMWSKDITLQAKFSILKYNLSISSYNKDLGLIAISGINNQYVTNQTTQVTYLNTVTISAFTSTDIRFIGWYDSNNKLVSTNAVFTFIMPNYDCTYIAKWNYFKVSYVLNGGSLDIPNPDSYTNDDGDVILNNPSKFGYDFKGWELNGEIIEKIPCTLNLDITLYAIREPHKYMITIDLNGGESTIESFIISFDQNYSLGIPTKGKMRFDGWLFDGKVIANNGKRRFDHGGVVKACFSDPGVYYQYDANSDSYFALKKNTKIEEIIIDETFLEKPVTQIYKSGFENCASLKTIIIPNSILLIDERAFYGCSSLTSITIPNSVTSIGNSAFYGCKFLSSVILSTNLTEIKNYTFFGCSVLTSITLHEGIISIGAHAFDGCRLNSFSIPNSVISIGIAAYSGCAFTSIVIPNREIEISKSAFSYCESLKSVEIPSSFTSISPNMFYCCSALTTIILPDNLVTISEYAFYKCTSLSSLSFENCAISIEPYAFSQCSSLSSISFIKSKMSININAFSDCSSLGSISFLDSTIILGKECFLNCTLLTSILISGGTTSIGNNAFSNCKSLETILIENSPTSIGDYAFSNCKSLDTILIENSPTSIGKEAFSYCNSLTTVIIPDCVTSIGQCAFKGCSNIVSMTIPFIGTSRNVEEELNDEINTKFTFSYIFDIDYIWSDGYIEYKLPKTLSEVIISSGCVSIPECAFMNCYSLTSILIPESVTSIGSYAFEYCSSLTSIVIPESVLSIGIGIFFECNNLTTISIPFIGGSRDENQFIGYLYGANEYKENSKYVNKALKEIIILENYERIPDYAFYGCENISSVNLPRSTLIIGKYAFYNCLSLISFVISEGVTEIGESAFCGCYRLIEVINESSLNIKVGSLDYGGVSLYAKYVLTDKGDSKLIYTNEYIFYKDEDIFEIVLYKGLDANITISDNITEIGNYAFYNNKTIVSIAIPNSVRFIGIGAFYGCTSLSSFIVPDEVDTIKEKTFYNCKSLGTIVISNKTTSIEDYAFYNCSSLSSVDLPNKVVLIGNYAFSRCSSLATIRIPNSVITLGNKSFSNCSILSTITIHDTCIEALNSDTFYDCFSLKNTYVLISDLAQYASSLGHENLKGDIHLLDENEQELFEIHINKNITFVESNAFRNCCFITSITIPNSVVSFGDYAFYNCLSLSSITLPDISVDNLKYGVFANCSKLENTYIIISSIEKFVSGNGHQNLKGHVHLLDHDMKEFTEIIIYENVTSLSFGAFYNCSSLTSITIPDSITSIGNSAFYGCSSLTSITIPDSVVNIGEYLFYNCSRLISVTIPNSVVNIGEHAFDNCRSLTSITIPDSVTSIEASTFANCWSLVSIIIPNSVVNIGSYAFYECSRLISVTIPNSVVNIGSYAFFHCSSLTSITIPNSVVDIGNRAFYRCYSLGSIILPNSIFSIGADAFYEINNSFAVYYQGTEDEWMKISGDGKDSIKSDHIYFYSENEPESDKNKYRHYVDGKPEVW